jgi:tryptophan synthase alpha chain
MIKVKSPNNQQILKKNGHILVGYLTAGYPDKESFYETLRECEKAKIDIFEIGYPAKKPLADGEVIQQAHQAIDMTIATDLQFWQRVRNEIESPIWLMAYKDDIMENNFCLELAKEKLIDAIVIPDMTFEERQELETKLVDFEVDVVGFISPDMITEQVQQCLENTALIYQQLYAGPTGMQISSDNYSQILRLAKQYNHINIFAGFGISTPERVNELLRNGFDGVIVGTAMMKKRRNSLKELVNFVELLKEATEGER